MYYRRSGESLNLSRVASLPDSAIRAITTNCNPVSGGAEEPMRRNVSRRKWDGTSMTVNRKC